LQSSNILPPGSIASPVAVSLDSSNNAFVVDSSTQSIYKVTPAGVKTLFYSGLGGTPYGIAWTSKGVFVSTRNATAGRVYLIDPTGTSATAVTSYNWKFPKAIASDGVSSVYVADFGTNQIVTIKSSDLSNPSKSFVNGTGPFAVTVSLNAQSIPQIFYSQNNIKGVFSLTTNKLISSAFKNPNSLALDSSGNLYVTDYATSMVFKITNPLNGGTPVAILSVNQPTGIAFTNTGSMVVTGANSGSGMVISVR